MDPYQVLGVKPSDSGDTIKKAYRKAAKECHPDTHPGNRRAEERFKEIGEAYRILSDKERRKAYDEKSAPQTAGWGKKAGTERRSTGSVPFDPAQMQSEFERFFGAGSAGGKESRGSAQKTNPIDMSAVFERYMGFKH